MSINVKKYTKDQMAKMVEDAQLYRGQPVLPVCRALPGDQTVRLWAEEDEMKTEEILTALRRLKVETGSLVCMGCGREHDCGVRGCRIMREAAELIEKLTDRCARYAEEIAVLQEREKWVPVTERLPEISNSRGVSDVVL